MLVGETSCTFNAPNKYVNILKEWNDYVIIKLIMNKYNLIVHKTQRLIILFVYEFFYFGYWEKIILISFYNSGL